MNKKSEILQAQKPSLLNDDQSYELVGEDISCNLGSMNLVNLMASPDFGKSIGTAMRALTYVSDSSSVDTVPTVKNGNAKNHTTALGLMNLHGYLAQNLLEYGSPESLEVTHAVFMMMNYYSLLESNKLAKERGEVFEDFHESDYASGKYFEKYLNNDYAPKTPRIKELFKGHHIPTKEDWERLMDDVIEYGIYNRYRLAVAP